MLLSPKRLRSVKKSNNQSLRRKKGGKRKKRNSYKKRKKSYNLRNKSLKNIKGGNRLHRSIRFFFLLPLEFSENKTTFSLVGIKDKKKAKELKKKFGNSFSEGYQGHLAKISRALINNDTYKEFNKLNTFTLERDEFNSELIMQEITLIQKLNHKIFLMQSRLFKEIEIQNKMAHETAKSNNNGVDPCSQHNKKQCNKKTEDGRPCNWSSSSKCLSSISKDSIKIYDELTNYIDSMISTDESKAEAKEEPEPAPVPRPAPVINLPVGKECDSKKDCGKDFCLPSQNEGEKGKCVPKPVYVSNMKQRKQEEKAREGKGDQPTDVTIPEDMFKEPEPAPEPAPEPSPAQVNYKIGDKVIIISDNSKGIIREISPQGEDIYYTVDAQPPDSWRRVMVHSEIKLESLPTPESDINNDPSSKVVTPEEPGGGEIKNILPSSPESGDSSTALVVSGDVKDITPNVNPTPRIGVVEEKDSRKECTKDPDCSKEKGFDPNSRCFKGKCLNPDDFSAAIGKDASKISKDRQNKRDGDDAAIKLFGETSDEINPPNISDLELSVTDPLGVKDFPKFFRRAHDDWKPAPPGTPERYKINIRPDGKIEHGGNLVDFRGSSGRMLKLNVTFSFIQTVNGEIYAFNEVQRYNLMCLAKTLQDRLANSKLTEVEKMKAQLDNENLQNKQCGDAESITGEYGRCCLYHGKLATLLMEHGIIDPRVGILSAGEIILSDAPPYNLVLIANKSGHFMPPNEHLKSVIHVLKRKITTENYPVKVQYWESYPPEEKTIILNKSTPLSEGKGDQPIIRTSDTKEIQPGEDPLLPAEPIPCDSRRDCGKDFCLPSEKDGERGKCVPKDDYVETMKRRKRIEEAKERKGDDPMDVTIPQDMFKETESTPSPSVVTPSPSVVTPEESESKKEDRIKINIGDTVTVAIFNGPGDWNRIKVALGIDEDRELTREEKLNYRDRFGSIIGFPIKAESYYTNYKDLDSTLVTLVNVIITGDKSRGDATGSDDYTVQTLTEEQRPFPKTYGEGLGTYHFSVSGSAKEGINYDEIIKLNDVEINVPEPEGG